MKKVLAICGILLCVLFNLTSCTKNTNPVDPPPVDTTDNPGTDTTPSKYKPGDTLELRGNISNNDETALLYSRDEGVSIPDYPAFAALGKDFGGVSGKSRSIMKFRIRHIDYDTRFNPPPIQKAVLYLYSYNNPTDIDPYIVEQDADNSIELHRVIGDWGDSTVTWSNQPALAQGSANPLEDVVVIPSVATPLASGTNDNQVIDITAMMQKIFTSKANKGFVLKLANEGLNAGRSYGSFACPSVSKRPKLVIYF